VPIVRYRQKAFEEFEAATAEDPAHFGVQVPLGRHHGRGELFPALDVGLGDRLLRVGGSFGDGVGSVFGRATSGRIHEFERHPPGVPAD
jgi:hypothetical protein